MMILIGAGRLATQLALNLHARGIIISHVFSRTIESANRLSQKIGAVAINDINKLRNLNADIWVYAVKDDAIESIAAQIPNNGALHIHTSGSVSIEVFKDKQNLYGSIYPLQTFNMDRTVNFDDIPLFFEANNQESHEITIDLCNSLSKRVCGLNSEKRKQLHLAAVLACNFTNALWANAEKILNNEEIPKDLIYPLIKETLEKAMSIGAANSQTGPAIRHDQTIIDKHIQMLEDNPLLMEIYRNITQLIQHDHKMVYQK